MSTTSTTFTIALHRLRQRTWERKRRLHEQRWLQASARDAQRQQTKHMLTMFFAAMHAEITAPGCPILVAFFRDTQPEHDAEHDPSVPCYPISMSGNEPTVQEDVLDDAREDDVRDAVEEDERATRIEEFRSAD